jgi:hypothetical protein
MLFKSTQYCLTLTGLASSGLCMLLGQRDKLQGNVWLALSTWCRAIKTVWETFACCIYKRKQYCIVGKTLQVQMCVIHLEVRYSMWAKLITRFARKLSPCSGSIHKLEQGKPMDGVSRTLTWTVIIEEWGSARQARIQKLTVCKRWTVRSGSFLLCFNGLKI